VVRSRLRVEFGEEVALMVRLVSNGKTKSVCVFIIILLTLGTLTGLVSAQQPSGPQAKIIPPSPYQVYTSQTYQLTIDVQYNIPKSVYLGTSPSAPSYYLWIASPPYQTGEVSVSGSGTTAFMLTPTAPSTPGMYTLALTLYGQSATGYQAVLDTASVSYQVIQPIITDWAVTRVWLNPSSPGEGDQVTFSAAFALVSTNSPQPLTVQVACLLDNEPYYTGSLTFNPQPSTQNVTVPQTWTATKGTHTLTCIIDPENQLNDVNPYPSGDFNEIRFVVQAYYAVIQSITTLPTPEVKEGDQFSVLITVSYHFPGQATLKVSHRNNQTQPASEDQADGTELSGSGTKVYTFKTLAPFRTPTNLTCTQKYMLVGQGFVWFDRGAGAGWEKTDPGWASSYNVTIVRPTYHAVFNQVTAQYAGFANATGRVAITLAVKYLLPIQTGLRITILRLNGASTGLEGYGMVNGTVIVRDQPMFTQQDETESTASFTYTYSYPPSSLSSGTLNFVATVDYQACGAWNHGDEGTVNASVPYTPPPKTAIDYLAAAVQTIINWLKSLFGALTVLTHRRVS
jgi:hypothetical protein